MSVASYPHDTFIHSEHSFTNLQTMKKRSATAKKKSTRRVKVLSNKAEQQNRESTLVALGENILEEVQNINGRIPYGLFSLLSRE